MSKKYKSASDSLRPGQLDALVDKLSDKKKDEGKRMTEEELNRNRTAFEFEALSAEAQAWCVESRGMHWENEYRKYLNERATYLESNFLIIALKLRAIAKKFRNMKKINK